MMIYMRVRPYTDLIKDIMEIIAKHFTDSSVSIRGYALEFYFIIAELFLGFDPLNPEIVKEYLKNPETFESKSEPVNLINF